jgi:hypothetical protein
MCAAEFFRSMARAGSYEERVRMCAMMSGNEPTTVAAMAL